MSWFSSTATSLFSKQQEASSAAKNTAAEVGGFFSNIAKKVQEGIDGAGRESGSGNMQQDVPLDAADVTPWATSNPTLRKHEAELKRLILQITEGLLEDVCERIKDADVEESFHFDLEDNVILAQKSVEADPRLQQARFKMVPSKMTEEDFWKHYFFLVNKVKNDLYKGIQLQGASSQTAAPTQRYPDESDNVDVQPERQTNTPSTSTVHSAKKSGTEAEVADRGTSADGENSIVVDEESDEDVENMFGVPSSSNSDSTGLGGLNVNDDDDEDIDPDLEAEIEAELS